MERINHGVLAVWPEGNAQVDGAAPCQPGGDLVFPFPKNGALKVFYSGSHVIVLWMMDVAPKGKRRRRRGDGKR